MELYSFLKQKRLFSEEECMIIKNAFNSEMIPKGTVIQQANRYSKKVFFLESGLVRLFYLKDGKDITHFFFDENNFVAPINSIFLNRSERYVWESIETCTMQTISYDDFLVLEEQFPKLTKLTLEFTIQILDILAQKLNLHQFQTASNKYKLFMEMYPNVHHRVSLGSIASFLGITQQTLSVIRGKKNKD